MTNVLALTADGRECARLDLDLETRVHFDIDPHIESIEVWGEDETGRLSLARLLIPFDSETGRQRFVEVTQHLPGGGQRISFKVVPRATEGDLSERADSEVADSTGAEVQVSFLS